MFFGACTTAFRHRCSRRAPRPSRARWHSGRMKLGWIEALILPHVLCLSIHLPTLLLLFSFMVISAQMRLGGFYTWATMRMASLPLGPAALLAAAMLMFGALSAVFSNDIVCLAVAPVLTEACLRRRLDPVPFLLGLACAANIGSPPSPLRRH